MTRSFSRGAIAAVCLALAGTAGAVEFRRQASLGATQVATGIQDRYGLAVAADGDTVAIAQATRLVEVWTRRGNAWQRQARIPGFGRYGHALALRGDRLLIGAPGEAGTSQPGEAEIWRRTGEAWVLESKLSAAAGIAGDAFGYSVALADGMALIGAPGHDGPQGDNQGALHVFRLDGRAWLHDARLLDPAARNGDLLGASVAWSGEMALGGAVGLDVQDRTGQGGVIVFAPAGSGWAAMATLVAADGAGGDTFGIAMAADAQRVVVGSHLDDVDGRVDAGSARVFVRDGERFVPEALLTGTGLALGYSVSLSGDAIALGGNSPGARVFRRTAQGWTPAAAPEPPSGDAAESVAIAGNVLVAGASRTDVGAAEDRGVASIATLDGAGWTTRTLLSSEDTPLDTLTFGWDIAIDQGRALIAAPALCAGFCPPTIGRGTAHFFERNANGELAFDKVAAGRPSRTGDGYAHAVSLRGDRALVASGGGYDWEDRPALEVFERGPDGEWRFAAQLLDGNGLSYAVEQVAIDGDIAVAGGRFELHLYHRDGGGNWRHEASFPAGLRGAYVLSALDVHADTVAVGISSWSGTQEHQGIVYLLVRRDGRWGLEARLLGDSIRHVGFGDQVSLHGNHLIVGESGAFAERPSAGVIAYERTARGWESRGRLAVPLGVRWHAGVAVRGDLAFAYARGREGSNVYAFEFRDGGWHAAGSVAAPGPRIAFDGSTLLVSNFGLHLNTASQVWVYSISR